jgi:hypothetical protein
MALPQQRFLAVGTQLLEGELPDCFQQEKPLLARRQGLGAYEAFANQGMQRRKALRGLTKPTLRAPVACATFLAVQTYPF